ncbi:MAG: DMT family transporter [Acidimicrobiia bacterium]|nr:DMT family transporter [Acidimicrobiia bacterium]
MGIALGLAAAFFFGVSSMLARVGMRTSPRDDGLYMTIFVNVVMLGILGVFVPRPDWNTAGVVSLAAAGLVGMIGGRHSNLRAIRFVGATRASVFITATPVVTATVGWFALDEQLGFVDALGGALVVASLLVLIRTRSTAQAVAGQAAHTRPHVIGYIFAVATPIMFGLAFVLRKWGLQSYDSTVLGVFIGATTALFYLSTGDLVQGRVTARLRENFSTINWWFVGAGVAISLALISQFWALTLVPAWVYAVLQGTQALWVMGLSLLLLRTEERIDVTLIASTVVVVAGVILIAVSL